MANKPNVNNSYKLVSAFLALILWGSWAFYVNEPSNSYVRFLVAGAQGLASFTITLIMVKIVTFFYAKLEKNSLQLILPTILTIALSASCLTIIHSVIGAPNILLTISPALSVAFLFCLMTTFQLRRSPA